MKVGLVARADDRGLGVMTWEFARHMPVDRVLVVREPGAETAGFEPHLDRYPGATVVRYDGGLPEDTVRGWLEGLDVVYGAETWYDPRFAGWADEAGVASVLHVMPEFYRPEMAASRLWAPTSWRLDRLPPGTRLVPVPVAADRFDAGREIPTDGPLRVLHVVGRRALADRNGTLAALQALRHIRAPIDIRVVTQDRRLPPPRGLGRHVTYQRALGGVDDYWRMYDHADVLLLPRRYGGLSLPAQEAMAAGLAVVMPDASPQNTDWPPVILLPARPAEPVAMPCGPVPLVDVSPRVIAATLDRLARDPAEVAAARASSLAWAGPHSWAALAGVYEAELASAAGLARMPA